MTEADDTGERAKGHRGSQTLMYGWGGSASVEMSLRGRGLLLSCQRDGSPLALTMVFHHLMTLLLPQRSPVTFALRARVLPLDCEGWHGLATFRCFRGPGKSVHDAEEWCVKPVLSSVLPRVSSLWGKWLWSWNLVQKSQEHWRQMSYVLLYNFQSCGGFKHDPAKFTLSNVTA